MFNHFNELQTPASSPAIDALCFLAITHSGGRGEGCHFRKLAYGRFSSGFDIAPVFNRLRKYPSRKPFALNRLSNLKGEGGYPVVRTGGIADTLDREHS
jgi:hypothetical protein